MDNREVPSCWINVDGLNIHYKCLGKGQPVVLVHGRGNDWHEWKNNLASIAQRFRVYAIDLPGFGLSQSPDGPVSPDWSAVFLKDFLESLGILNPHLIGHSMGALISIVFAAHYPEWVNKLVLIDAGGLGKISRKGRILLSMFQTLDRWLGNKRGPQFLEAPGGEWLVVDDLPKIQSPSLIVWGENDFYLPASHSQLAQTLIPDSRLYIFPHCGHAPQREFPEKFNGLVSQFLTAAH